MDRNNITDVGRNALHDAIFNTTSLNAMFNCNNTCCITGLGGDEDYNTFYLERNRMEKIYQILSSRNREGSNAHQLDLELRDDSLNLVPKVLQCVDQYYPHFRRHGD